MTATKRLSAFLTLIIACCALAQAQMMEPIKWKHSLKMNEGNTSGVISFTASVENGWHLYSTDIDPNIGPSPLSFTFETVKGAKLVGKPKPNKAAHKQFEEMFGAELTWFTGSVTFSQQFQVTDKEFQIVGYLTFMGCNDENCLPPTNCEFDVKGKGAPEAKPEEKAEEKAEENTEAADSLAAPADSVASDAAPVDSVAVAPVAPTDDNGGDNGEEESSGSLLYIFITCFLAGFIALVTPCVWPMIPLTVSFFLKKNKSRSKSIMDALIYGFSIILIYVVLGLLVTMIFGAQFLNELSTSAVCNIIFFLLLVVFAISFFGAFDIKLPDSWANKMDSTAEKTSGVLSIFFMAFTLTLVSFSCTGPIIGTLLVEAASMNNIIAPAVGMFAFALALAIPFCLFAMFPSMLKQMPKSGSWMNTVKVVLGFIELALSLKFLSVADMAYGWHILDREIYLALWIVIFALMGIYLLGHITFSHYGKDDEIGVTRFFFALASLAFAVYLLPGLWGAPLRGVSAFLPLQNTQDFDLYKLQEGGFSGGGGESAAEFKVYNDYEEGVKVAKEKGLPIFLDFTGYGCVNCRKMEGAVLDKDSVKNYMHENFVMIQLFCDDKHSLPETIVAQENGKDVKIRTVGDKWSYLQRTRYNANAQPLYIVVDYDGTPMSGTYSYDEDINKFMKFLRTGVQNFNTKK